MPAAARVGDQTSHGTPLTGIGSPNVLIEGKPAWRVITDVHTCPQVDGTKPHVGGVISRGSNKVFINKSPAARQGDTISEAGPPNAIAMGALKVSIGG